MTFNPSARSIRRAVRWALLASAAAASASLPAQTPAQAGDEAIETVVITGSAIRRIEGETALPVQVLDAEAITKSGAFSVVDLIQRLPSIQGNTMESDSIGGATFGFSGVSLHNVGENRTLVLLNGRRMAMFGGQSLTGFGAAVDLNSIPVSAIERVEILSDGASALYGSDAVAGVVNFITKGRTTERDAQLSYYAPDGGAEERGISLTGGIGDYDESGWNLFVSLAADERTELHSRERDFARSAIVNFEHSGGLWSFFNGSPRNIPANLIADAGSLDGATVSLDFLQSGTCPEGSAQVGLACYFDYVRFIQIYPERERQTATSALNVRMGEDNNIFLDVLYSNTEQVSRVAPVPGELLVTAGSTLHNQHLAPVRDANGDPVFVGDIVASYRGLDLGQRINDDEARFYHASTGLEGELVGWDYELAISQSESDVKGSISGYPGGLAFNRLMASGLVNPFVGPGQQTPEATAAIEAVNYQGYWDGGTSRLQMAELRGSRGLFDLPNGNPVLFAGGLSYYQEKFQSKPSDFAQANLDDPVAGTPAAGGPGTGDQRFGDAAATIPYSADRSVFGAFVESAIKPLDWLELNASVRFDDYDDVGSSTNYKGSFRLTPVDRWLLRGSYGTGFHAPTVPQIKAARQYFGVTSNPFDCSAELQAIATNLGAVCRPPQTQYDQFTGGNPALTPEESRQASFGVVFEATPRVSLGVDYWWVGIEDAFGQLDENAVFGDPNSFPNAWTTFTDIGTGTTYIALDVRNINTGKEYYSGLDFNLQGRWETPIGRLRSQLFATHMLTNKVQQEADGPYFENISDYNSTLDNVTFRWAGKVLTTLEHGPFAHAVTANFRSGYTDDEKTVNGLNSDGTFNGETMDVRLEVDDYVSVDWQSTWTIMESFDLTVGALNVLDEDPPRSLTTANFQIGYDARYYDPRGRTLFGKVLFRF
jgi:iron complex outermembrane recepter protein